MEEFLQCTPLTHFPLKDFSFETAVQIGEGASGTVYKHFQDKKYYAIKVLDSNDWEDDEFYKNSLYESFVIAHINQNNLSIHFFGYHTISTDYSDSILFIMEYVCSNGDLYDFINHPRFWNRDSNSPLDYSFENQIYVLERAKKLVISKLIIESIEQLHDKEVVHGDIKSNNILCYNDKEKEEGVNIRLIDFGASVFTEGENGLFETEWKHGTLGYSSPEEKLNNLIGLKSDIYSVGVTLIELWAGGIWNDGEDFNVCRNEVLMALRKIEKVEEKVGPILRKCISLDSKRRPTIKKLSNMFVNIQ
tara:strand:- start:5267 stop:6181 length:915 start_codon:yes stop_codon:yes gene_type:complete